MYAYKGFEPDLSCRGYRFVMGKNVTPEANCASNGFHCAEDLLWRHESLHLLLGAARRGY